MGAILLRKPEELAFDSLLNYVPKKTGKGESYSYAAGETRLRIELEGQPKKVIDSYIKKYRDICDRIYSAMIDSGAVPHDEKKFAITLCSVFYSNMKFAYSDVILITEFLDSGKLLDCEVSAFIGFDIGKRLGIKGVEIVSVPHHVFLRTENFGIETTSTNPRKFAFKISALKVLYPTIYMSTSDLEKIQSLTYFARGSSKFSASKYYDARSDFSIAIRLNPSSADSYSNRGTASYAMGDISSAIQDFSAAIKLNPAYAGTYYNRAAARKKMGDNQGYDSDMAKFQQLSAKK